VANLNPISSMGRLFGARESTYVEDAIDEPHIGLDTGNTVAESGQQGDLPPVYI
jgi:hypothetical protein